MDILIDIISNKCVEYEYQVILKILTFDRKHVILIWLPDIGYNRGRSPLQDKKSP